MKTNNHFVSPLALVIGVFMLSLLLSACNYQKGVEPLPVGEMQTYVDPALGFSIEYPKGWHVNAQVGRAHFYNDRDVELQFLNPNGSNTRGVVIAVTAKQTNDVKATIETFREDMAKSGSRVGAEQTVKVGNHEGLKIPYTATYDSKTVIHGYHILVTADSVVYDLGVAGFGDFFDAYSAVFEASLNSFQLPKSQAIGVSGF